MHHTVIIVFSVLVLVTASLSANDVPKSHIGVPSNEASPPYINGAPFVIRASEKLNLMARNTLLKVANEQFDTEGQLRESKISKLPIPSYVSDFLFVSSLCS